MTEIITINGKQYELVPTKVVTENVDSVTRVDAYALKPIDKPEKLQLNLTEYEIGIIYGVLTIDQWRNLPDTLKSKLRVRELISSEEQSE